MPLRVATLTRRSTDEQHQPFSIEAQDTKLAAYIQSQDDWRLIENCRYTDDMSGATLDRPGLKRALLDARAGRYDILLVYRVDRVARTLRGLLEVLDQLEQAGVAFCSASEHFDTHTPVGRMIVQILGAFAEFERATIIDRVIAGMERKAASGAWCGGARPYGYQVDTTTGYLSPHPGEAPLVPTIFDRYTSQRHGARAIAAWLNRAGHRTRAGRPWSHASVITVLRNRVYLGEISYRGQHHPAPHPPLIDPATFQAAQRLLQERGEDRRTSASNASDYLLAGKLVCTHCGLHYVGTAAIGNRYRYRYYTCFSLQRYGKQACPSQRLPADQLDQAILAGLLDTFARTDLAQQATRAIRSQAAGARDRAEGELAAIRTEIDQAEAAIERYLGAFEAGTLPEAQCGKRVQALGAKLADLQARELELQQALAASATQEPPTPADLDELASQLRQVIEHAPVTAKKALAQQLVHEIRVASRDDIRPIFRIPTRHEPSPGEGEKVRKLVGSVPLAGLEPATCCVEEVSAPSGLSPGVRSGYGRWNEERNDQACPRRDCPAAGRQDRGRTTPPRGHAAGRLGEAVAA
jgi:site-specific DNA recombinase